MGIIDILGIFSPPQTHSWLLHSTLGVRRMEIFSLGCVVLLRNFRRLHIHPPRQSQHRQCSGQRRPTSVHFLVPLPCWVSTPGPGAAPPLLLQQEDEGGQHAAAPGDLLLLVLQLRQAAGLRSLRPSPGPHRQILERRV